MPEPPELVTASDVTLATLARAFEAAGFGVAWLGLEDEPGLREKYLADALRGTDWVDPDDRYVFTRMLTRDRPPPATVLAERSYRAGSVNLLTTADLKPDAPRGAALKYVNRVNRRLTLVRAYVPREAGEVVFDYAIDPAGGVTTAFVAHTAHRFADIVHLAVTELDTDGVLA